MISDFVKTILLYSIVIVSSLSMFHTLSTIMDVLASSIEDPNRTSADGLDSSYGLHDQKEKSEEPF